MPSRPVSAPTSISVLPGLPVVENTSREVSIRPTHMALTNGFPEYDAEKQISPPTSGTPMQFP